MGDAQSAQREGKKDAAAEGESGKVDDAQTEQNIEDKPLKNNAQISEINGKTDGSIAEVNGHCEDEIAAEAILSQDEDILDKDKPLKEDTQLVNVEINEKESPTKADANEDAPLEIIEIDTKQNDINEGFRRFFSNIGLKLTVKRGSSEITTDVPDKEEPKRPEDVGNTTKETISENTELNTDVKTAQETFDNDLTACPTVTDTTLDVQEKTGKETAETKEEVNSDNANAATTPPVEEDALQDATSEEEPHSTTPSSNEEDAAISPIKRFFTTGIFSGLRKKKKLAEDETTEKELVDMGIKEAIETTDQTVQDQQQVKEKVSPGVETAAVEAEHKENEHKEQIPSAASAQITDEGRSSYMDPSNIISTEPEILSSQEKNKVQASPLRRLMSGSSLKKLAIKQRSKKSSDAKLSDSGEHVSDQLLSSTESAENQKEEGPVQPSADAAGEDDGAWASFKKLLTPKKFMKRSLSNDNTQIPGSVEEPRPSEGEQISDHSTEEGKKRKDSSVSWEAVLCGSGRRRSRKTSDSEDEAPPTDKEHKQDGESKNVVESSNENEILASSPKQAGSPSDSDGGSTWKSLKRLVTPKRKAKDEEETKDNIQSDSEVTQEESPFSIKKLLPGRKKRKSATKQEQVSSDEADKDVASGDEDSETPAVIPLSEFDTVETEVHIQTQADIENHITKEANYELQQDLPVQMAEPVLPCDSLQTEAKKIQDNDDALDEQVPPTSATNEEFDDLTESISKHQQLSDIPEEGIITETMATPASATEEVVRDDTIAEDLIEITSEAITAPEPASDITLADETEMISAVSQLSSESSKTSGNTTPVPAEYDLVETNTLLHQVVETISMSPKAVTVFSNELSSEKIVGSVSHQIFETLVKEEPTLLERHRRFDATAIKTGLNVEELDAITKLKATSQTESISEVNESVSTEVVSKVPTEEFDTAEIAVDEIQQASITYLEEKIIEVERTGEGQSHHMVECLSEVNAAMSTDILPESQEIVLEVGSPVEDNEAETEPPRMDSKEEDVAATAADETKDKTMEQELQAVTEKMDNLIHNITDQIQVKNKNQPPVEAEELQESPDVQTVTLDSEDDRVQSLEKDVTSEDTPPAETVSNEVKEEIMPLTEVSIEAEKEDELVANAVNTEHVQLPEASEAEQCSIFDSEDRFVQSRAEEVKSGISLAETTTDELKQTAEHLTEDSAEPENKEVAVNALMTEDVQELESEAEQLYTFSSGEKTVQSTTEKVKSDKISQAETVTDELKQLAEHLTEDSAEPEYKKLPVSALTMEHIQKPEAAEVVQLSTFESEGSVQSIEDKVKSENIQRAETVTDEPKKKAEHLTEDSVEPGNEELPVNALITEHVQVPEASEAEQSSTLGSEERSVQSTEEVKSDIQQAGTVMEEPKKTAEHLTEDSVEPGNEELPVNAVITEHVQVPEASEAEQSSTLGSEERSVQSTEEVKSDIQQAGTVMEEPKKTAEHLTEDSVEPGNEELPVNAVITEHVQVPETSEAEQSSTFDSEERSVQSTEEVKSDIQQTGTVMEEPKKTAEHLTEDSVEPGNEELPVNALITEHVQVPEASEAEQSSTLDSEERSVQSTEEVKSDIQQAGTVMEEPKKTAEHLTEDSVEPGNEELPVNAVITEHVQVPEASEAEQSSTFDSEERSVQSTEEVKSDIQQTGTVMEEPKKTAEHLTEDSVEPGNEELPVNALITEHVQVPEASEAEQSSTLDSEERSVQSTEEEVKSDIQRVGTVMDEPKKTAEHLTEDSVEPGNEELPVNALITEHVQVPEASEAEQSSTLDSEERSVQSTEEVKSDIQQTGTVMEEPKKKAEHLTEDSVEPGNEELPVNALITEHVQVPEASEAEQSSTLGSEERSVQSTEEVKSDIQQTGTVMEEPKKTAEHLTEDSVEPGNEELPVNALITEHVQVPEASEAEQSSTLGSEERSVQSTEEIKSDIQQAGTVMEEPKKTAEHLTEDSVEPGNEELPVNALITEHVQVPEASEAEQSSTFDSEERSVQSTEEVKSDIQQTGTVMEEPKKTAEHLTEDSVEPGNEELPVNAVITEHVQVPETSEAEQSSTFDSEERSVQSTEEIKSDIQQTGTVMEEPKKTAEHLTEDSVEPGNEELPVNALITEHVQVPEASEAEQSSTLDSEERSVQSTEEVKSDIQQAGTVMEEPKKTAEHLTEDSVEPGNEELPVNAVITEHVQVPETSEAEQSSTFDSEERSVQSTEEVKSDIQQTGTVMEEPKKTAEHLTEDSVEPGNEELPVNALITEHVQVPEASEAEQSSTLDSEERSVQSTEEEVKSDIQRVGTVMDEPKKTAEHLTEDSVEPGNEELPVNALITEHVQVPEASEAEQSSTLDSEERSVQSTEEVKSDIQQTGTVMEEPKKKAEHLTEDSVEPGNEELPVNALITEHVQVPEASEAEQSSTLGSEERSVQSTEEVKSDIQQTGTVMEEPKKTAEHLTEDSVEPGNEELPVNALITEHVQVPEASEAEQSSTFDSEERSVQSTEEVKSDIQQTGTVMEEPKKTAEHLTEDSVEPGNEELPVNALITEHVQVPEASEAEQSSTFDSEERSVQSTEEVKSDIQQAGTVMEEPKKTAEHLTEDSVEPGNEELPVNALITEHVQVPEASEAEQSSTFDSEERSVQSTEEVKSDIQQTGTVMEEPKKTAEHLTEDSVEPGNEELPVNALITEHVQVPEASEAEQSSTFDSEERSVQSTEEVKSDIQQAGTVMEEPKKTAEHLTEDSVEPQKTESPVNDIITEHDQEPELSEALQAATLDLEEGSIQMPQEEVIAKDVPDAETVKDESKKDSVHLTEVNHEPTDASKTKHVQEPEPLLQVTLDSEEGTPLPLEKKVTSEDIPEVEIVTDGPRQETELNAEPEEKIAMEGSITEYVQEPEILPSNIKDIANETKTEENALMSVDAVTESAEGDGAQELKKQILSEDLPKPDTNNVIDSVSDEIESEDMAQLGQSLDITEDQTNESILYDVQVEQENSIPEVVDELQTLTAVHVSSVNEDAGSVQVLENTRLSENTLASLVDNASVTDEPKHKMHLSSVKIGVEQEKESKLPGTEIKTAAVEHAVVAQVVVCNLKDVSIAIPDVLIEKTTQITEPLIDTVAGELVYKEEVEAATLFVKDHVAETAEDGSVIMMMHVPSVTLEDNNRIQVQVVEVDVKSAESTVDSVLEVGVTETKEVLGICHETVKNIDNLSATADIEEEIFNEESKVTVEEVVQHVKQKLPETESINLEQEFIKQPDTVTKVSETVISESNEEEEQKVMEDSTVTFREPQDEAPSPISDDSAMEQRIPQDLIQTPDIPGDSDIFIHDRREDIEESKAECEKSDVDITAQVKTSEEQDGQNILEQAQVTQIAHTPTATPTNTGLVVPQNTGIISSIGNVESLSSLSLEFKLNIQFGQAKAPAPPQPTTERVAPVKQTDVSEVGVQADEPVKPKSPIQGAENQKQTELTKVPVQASEIIEPNNTTQAVLLDVGIQSIETVEQVEQIKTTENVTSSIQVSESIQPVRLKEKREVLLSQLVLSEACYQETKAKEPVKKIEEENDQDVWMDAEEVIYTQEEREVSLLELKEPLTAKKQEERGLGHEVEMAPDSHTEEADSQREMHITEGTREIESEGEDFAVALEHPETSASITTMELD